MALTLAVHGMLAASALFWHSHTCQPPAKASLSVVMVELASDPLALPAPPPALPPAQRQHKQTRSEPRPIPEPLPDTDNPEYEPVPEPEPEPELELELELEPRLSLADNSQTSTPSPSYSPSTPHLTASSNVSGTDQQAIRTWQSVLLAHLEKYRRYPRQAQRLRQQGISHVRFVVDRQGRISDPRIGHSSGHRLLDEETLATVLRASPVPPPPPEIEGHLVEVMVPVSFFIRKR